MTCENVRMKFEKQAEPARFKGEPRFITAAWWLVVLIMPLLAMTEAAHGRELLTNGDFENGTAGWSVPNGNFTVSGEDLPQ